MDIYFRIPPSTLATANWFLMAKLRARRTSDWAISIVNREDSNSQAGKGISLASARHRGESIQGAYNTFPVQERPTMTGQAE